MSVLISQSKALGVALINRHPWCQVELLEGGNGTSLMRCSAPGLVKMQVYNLEKATHYVYKFIMKLDLWHSPAKT